MVLWTVGTALTRHWTVYTSDDGIDETITFDNDKAEKTYRKHTDEQRKRAKTVKTKKVITTKIYAINIIETKKRKSLTERKR